MNRLDLSKRVRSLTRDFSNAIFREQDIIDYINEGIDRIKQVIVEFEKMPYLLDNADIPTMLPGRYHHLLSLYSASRCFGQDERHYQASNFMNEFETKMDELRIGIEEGKIKIIDPDTNEVIEATYEPDYVTNNYYRTHQRGFDVDKGVEGVR